MIFNHLYSKSHRHYYESSGPTGAFGNLRNFSTQVTLLRSALNEDYYVLSSGIPGWLETSPVRLWDHPWGETIPPEHYTVYYASGSILIRKTLCPNQPRAAFAYDVCAADSLINYLSSEEEKAMDWVDTAKSFIASSSCNPRYIALNNDIVGDEKTGDSLCPEALDLMAIYQTLLSYMNMIPNHDRSPSFYQEWIHVSSPVTRKIVRLSEFIDATYITNAGYFGNPSGFVNMYPPGSVQVVRDVLSPSSPRHYLGKPCWDLTRDAVVYKNETELSTGQYVLNSSAGEVVLDSSVEMIDSDRIYATYYYTPRAEGFIDSEALWNGDNYFIENLWAGGAYRQGPTGQDAYDLFSFVQWYRDNPDGDIFGFPAVKIDGSTGEEALVYSEYFIGKSPVLKLKYQEVGEFSDFYGLRYKLVGYPYGIGPDRYLSEGYQWCVGIEIGIPGVEFVRYALIVFGATQEDIQKIRECNYGKIEDNPDEAVFIFDGESRPLPVIGGPLQKTGAMEYSSFCRWIYGYQVSVYENGVLIGPGEYAIDYDGGKITFNAGEREAITASYTKQQNEDMNLSVSIKESGEGDIPPVKSIECSYDLSTWALEAFSGAGNPEKMYLGWVMPSDFWHAMNYRHPATTYTYGGTSYPIGQMPYADPKFWRDVTSGFNIRIQDIRLLNTKRGTPTVY